MGRPPDKVRPPAETVGGTQETTGRDVDTSITRTPVNPGPATRYGEKFCVECLAPFTPTSGRGKFCPLHREPKFRTARNSDAQRHHRSDPQQWRVPTSLPVCGNRRQRDDDIWITDRDRGRWIRDALRLARKLQRDGYESCAKTVVGWAERTSLGEIRLAGCHWLNSLCDCEEFTHYGQHLAPFGWCSLGAIRGTIPSPALSSFAGEACSPTEANYDKRAADRTPSDLGFCETQAPGMSESKYLHQVGS